MNNASSYQESVTRSAPKFTADDYAMLVNSGALTNYQPVALGAMQNYAGPNLPSLEQAAQMVSQQLAGAYVPTLGNTLVNPNTGLPYTADEYQNLQSRLYNSSMQQMRDAENYYNQLRMQGSLGGKNWSQLEQQGIAKGFPGYGDVGVRAQANNQPMPSARIGYSINDYIASR